MKQIAMIWHSDANNPITLHLVTGEDNLEICQKLDEMTHGYGEWIRWNLDKDTVTTIRDLLIKALAKVIEEINDIEDK